MKYCAKRVWPCLFTNKINLIAIIFFVSYSLSLFLLRKMFSLLTCVFKVFVVKPLLHFEEFLPDGLHLIYTNDV